MCTGSGADTRSFAQSDNVDEIVFDVQVDAARVVEYTLYSGAKKSSKFSFVGPKADNTLGHLARDHSLGVLRIIERRWEMMYESRVVTTSGHDVSACASDGQVSHQLVLVRLEDERGRRTRRWTT